MCRRTRSAFLLLIPTILILSITHQTVSTGEFNPTPSDFRVFGEEVVSVQTSSGKSPQRYDYDSSSPAEEDEDDDQLIRRRVSFEAFNKNYNLTLRPTVGLLSPSFGLILRDGEGNVTERRNPVAFNELSRCFYRGADAAFDLCGGLRGIVTLSSNEFLSVSPIQRRKRGAGEDDQDQYLVRRIGWTQQDDLTHHHRRSRRSSSSGQRRSGGHYRNNNHHQAITVETAVFVDAYLYSHMTRTHFTGDEAEQEMTHFVLAMINAVQLLYQDESLGREIAFQVQRLEMWSRQPQELQPALTGSGSSTSSKQGIHDIDRYLNRFCHWQSRENPQGDQDSEHWDHALLLTGLDLFAVGRDGVSSHQIVGLAPIGGMCTSTSSCTVNEGRHFEAVYVVAHEIGHNLGMKHDGREAGNDCDPGSFLMSPTLGSGKTQWSPCSQHYLNSFLNTAQAGCLMDRSWIPERMDHNASGTLPGERFTADDQCTLRYGRGSRRAPQRSLSEICRDLRCTNHNSETHRSVRQTGSVSGTTSYTSHPALEGTTCGEGMWCRKGRCSSRVRFQHYQQEADPAIISMALPTSVGSPFEQITDSSWSTVSPCASGCLLGNDFTLKSGSMAVTLQMQNCDTNSRCSNIPVRYQTCDGSQVCSAVNRTTIQEYSDDICSQAALQNGSILPRGIQQLSVDPFRSCQVWCYLKSGGLMTSAGWNFPDGTRCQAYNNYRPYNNRMGLGSKTEFLCLSGRCQEFNCDGRSAHQLHAEACRPEAVAVESNIIHDSAFYAQPMVTSYKYGDRYQNHHHQQHQRRQPVRAVDQQPNYDPYPQSQHSSINPARFAMLTEQNSGMNSSSSTVPWAAAVGWGPWKPVSACRSGCLSSSKGLRLVQRTCQSGSCGSGSSESVQLCIPNEQECPNMQTASSFADQVCREQYWSSHNRRVWTSSAEQVENSCVVHCRDPHNDQMIPVEGDNGWFPSGTLCNHRTSAYCLSGRCVEFDDEGIPK